MSSFAVNRDIRWYGQEFAFEDDRRFRKLLIAVAIPFLLLAILSALYKIEGRKEGGGTYSAPTYVELLPAEVAPLAEKIEEPAPAKNNDPEPPKQAAPKQADRPTPTPEPLVSARDVAKRSGVLAFADALNDLRSKGDAINPDQALITSKGAASSASGGAASGAADGQALAAAAAGSSGIGGSGTDGVTKTQSGQGLGKRKTTTVKSPVGFGRDASKAGEAGTSKSKGRSLDEIQLQFDRAAGAFNAMYLRALRENAALAGKVVLRITIAPDGHVLDCSVVSSELGDSELEAKILAKVRSMNFGAKDVPSFTYPNYPIRFQPPS